jgi:RNA polymerase sigma-70 factor, ECF subfamily
MNEQEQRTCTELMVIRCQQGDKEAFELMVNMWQKPLLSFALRYLDQEADAQDVVQETWVAVTKGLSDLQNPSLFVSWLFRTMTNKCIDRIRKQQSQQRRLERTDIKAVSSDVSDERESLSLAIEQLPREHRILITLRFEQGLQIGQIAAMLNTAEGTVKSRLHRSLRRLRDILGNTM